MTLIITTTQTSSAETPLRVIDRLPSFVPAHLCVFERSSAPRCSRARNADERAVLSRIKRLLFAVVPDLAREIIARNAVAPNLAHEELSATKIAKGVFRSPAFGVAVVCAQGIALRVVDRPPFPIIDSESDTSFGPGRTAAKVHSSATRVHHINIEFGSTYDGCKAKGE
jgi:hypothetical protein